MRRLTWVIAAFALAQNEPPARDLERQRARELLAIQRVYVDRFGAGDGGALLRDMIIAALERRRLFVVTEDESRADAYLRGSAEDLIFTDLRQVRDGVQVRASARAARRDRDGADAASASLAASEQEERTTRERRHEAAAAVRLVARSGDVLWSATHESLGAKYKGAGADVADRIGRELEAAWARARRAAAR